MVKARAAWAPIRSRFSDDEQRYAAGQLAYASARRLDTAEAMEWAKRAQDGEQFTRLGDWQAAWIARAALRAGAWKDVQRAIAAMSPSANGGQADPAWRYWKARALVALGDPLAAQPIYVDLAKEPSYYGLLAAEEINAALPTVAALNGGALKLSEVDFKRFRPVTRCETGAQAVRVGAPRRRGARVV